MNLMFWVFGGMDLLTAGAILLGQHGMVGARLMVVFAAYLCSKAFLFKGDLASLLDLLSGIYILFLIFGLNTFIAYLIAAYLAQKGVLSFL